MVRPLPPSRTHGNHREDLLRTAQCRSKGSVARDAAFKKLLLATDGRSDFSGMVVWLPFWAFHNLQARRADDTLATMMVIPLLQ